MSFKKVLISIAIILVIAILVFAGFKIYKYVTPVTVTSNNNEFSLQIPGKVDFKEAASGSSEYVLDLYSVKDQMMLYSTILDTNIDMDLKTAITAEKDNISNSRENAKVATDVTQMNIPNCEAYKYAFTYHDPNFESDLYSTVVWIKTDKHIYILDFEVISDKQNKYIPIFDDIANSFVENN